MKNIKNVGVCGAGTMGSALAQKFSQEGFKVILLDKEERFIENGLKRIKETVEEGIERRIFNNEQAEQILNNIKGTTDITDLAECDIVTEAIFENREAKNELFRALDKVISKDAIIATNTSSYSVTELAENVSHKENFTGMHYFYHAAKNRLAEIIPGKETSDETIQVMKRFAVMTGKDAIICKDSYGFAVNRFFVPWLNEAVRLYEESTASTAEIDRVCMKLFSIGMGPFALMNATGVPVAYHAQKTLEYFGELYRTADALKRQTELNEPWTISENDNDEISETKQKLITERMLGIVFLVCSQILDEEICTATELNRGARIGLRWRKGPVDMMQRYGEDKVREYIRYFTDKYRIATPGKISREAWKMQFVKYNKIKDTGIITISRPEDMNALNETIMKQLNDIFDKAESDDEIRNIVITGEGKAFVAGADIKFFVDNIKKNTLDRIVEFTSYGQRVYEKIDKSRKKVTALVNGLALGGGLELALCCDVILALPKAILAFPETGIGIYPGLGGTQRTRERIGKALTKYMIFTGDMLTAKQAEKTGLIDKEITTEEYFSISEGKNLNSYRREEKPVSDERYSAIGRIFTEHTLDDILQSRLDEKILQDKSAEKMIRKIRSKAPIALNTAERLIDEERGCNSELDRLTYIFSTSDALLGLSSIGKKVEFQNK